jgi:hypothetical protein
VGSTSLIVLSVSVSRLECVFSLVRMFRWRGLCYLRHFSHACSILNNMFDGLVLGSSCHSTLETPTEQLGEEDGVLFSNCCLRARKLPIAVRG